jgi:ribosomal protein S18 acetylase RimI-like enzyme
MPDLTLRPAGPDDREFVLAVCRAAMADHHRAARGWDHAQVEAAFVRHLELPATQIVLDAGTPVGILTVLRGPRADLISRIALLPTVQRRGLGTALVRRIQERCAGEGRPVRLSVYKCNPAWRLYRRLGFEITGETEIEYHMLWRPPPGGAGQSSSS